MFQVCEKRCDECLFSKNKIVPEARKKQILRDIKRKGNYFICHKSTMVGGKACCRGFYDDEASKDSRVIHLARALDVVEFVDLAKEEKLWLVCLLLLSPLSSPILGSIKSIGENKLCLLHVR